MFQIFSGIENVYGYEKVDIKIFRIVFCVSQCGKDHFVGESLRVSIILGIENFMDKRGGKRSVSVQFFCNTVPKRSVGRNLSVFRSFMVSKKFA